MMYLRGTTTKGHTMSSVRVTITRSAGPDGAILVMIDTDDEPDGSDGSTGMRVTLNEATIFDGKPYEPLGDAEPRKAHVHVLDVPTMSVLYADEKTATCRHCERDIVLRDGRWIDLAAGYAEDGDGVWRETCDRHDTFTAEHEPDAAYYATIPGVDSEGNALDIAEKDAEDEGWRLATEAEVADHVGEWGLPGLEHRTEGDTLLVRPVGPRTYTSTITPAAEAALRESTARAISEEEARRIPDGSLGLTHTPGAWDGTFGLMVTAMLADLLSDGAAVPDVTVTYYDDGGTVRSARGDVLTVDHDVITFTDHVMVRVIEVIALSVAS